MAVSDKTKPFPAKDRTGLHGPEILFAAAVLASFAILAFAAAAFPDHFALPVTSTLLLASAGLAALIAWLRERGPESDRVTYWDVAGALTLIGISAGTLVDPDHLLRIVDSPPREK
jgi:hypothetical protein